MEIPEELQKLYSHWEKHSNFKIDKPHNSIIDFSLLSQIELFISERMYVWEKKISNSPKPFTSDQILSNYRFCNIYRELDKQTITIHKDISNLKSNFDLWLLNLAFHRFVCRPETISEVGHLSFDDSNNRKVFDNLSKHSRPKYGTAYIFPISTIQRSKYTTREEFFCFYLPLVIPEISELLQSFENKTVNSSLKEILPLFKFNLKFHWTEILIDVAYQFPELINLFEDFHVGPGAIPTLQRLVKSNDINSGLNELPNIELKSFPYLTLNDRKVPLSAENWEGIGCEFRKYTNLKKGAGRKRRF